MSLTRYQVLVHEPFIAWQIKYFLSSFVWHMVLVFLLMETASETMSYWSSCIIYMRAQAEQEY